jgi:hypothetical protein
MKIIPFFRVLLSQIAALFLLTEADALLLTEADEQILTG